MYLLSVLRWITWNLLLAAIPVALAFSMRRWWSRKARILVVLAGFLWLIFLPNTCYLLTEWRHFFNTLEGAQLYTQWKVYKDMDALRWLILCCLFYLSYSAVGMLAFALAVRPVYGLLRRSNPQAWLWGIPFFPLISLGVYLGLIQRLNSWNLLHEPGRVIGESWRAVTRPELFTFILAFGAFLWLAYFLLDIWVDGALLRRQRITSANEESDRSLPAGN